jgi:hypothetical protein
MVEVKEVAEKPHVETLASFNPYNSIYISIEKSK